MAGDGAAIRVGTAGWSLPRAVQGEFPGEGPHLARYARVLPAAEINSSFHRPHKPSVYARWAAATPASFRFAVKIPKTVTHGQRLADAEALLAAFVVEAQALGDRLECLLVQLPPSLALDREVARRFFAVLRELWSGDVVLEPRHETWFTAEANAMLEELRVGRVAADPVRAAGGDVPAGWPGIAYYRLHGSPRTYYSSYQSEYLATLADSLVAHRRAGVRSWCIFDNTASGAAAGNALELMRLLASRE
ncbi:MAG TPA: DUF72 domain-containing protein [Gemmatimonadaceae bacterium]|nr:DUF72 domain-containing protein [Gemmatimonadaceae bacterium]